MPNYRRLWIPGVTYFVTIMTHQRRAIFSNDSSVQLWREAIRQSQQVFPFDVLAGVVLPNHVHLLISLPACEGDLSKRVGLCKAKFSSMLKAGCSTSSASRQRHRETDVWQRRFYDRMIRDEDELSGRLDYIHFNPVKHGYCERPIDWPYSSFAKFVKDGHYPPSWMPSPGSFDDFEDQSGEA
ncbi:REP-associated tyrosine transposase [Algisphaera agarilytica]|nr:transposase [Algisphaera agarilytica]